MIIMAKDSAVFIITALIFGMLLATLFPYIQQQISSPTFLEPRVVEEPEESYLIIEKYLVDSPYT